MKEIKVKVFKETDNQWWFSVTLNKGKSRTGRFGPYSQMHGAHDAAISFKDSSRDRETIWHFESPKKYQPL